MPLPDSFWRGARVGTSVSVVALCALAGSFVGTGLPTLLDALLGGLLGALVLFLAFFAARFVSFVGRRVPSGFLVLFAAAGATLVVLREVDFGLPESLFYPAGGVFLFAQAVLAGALWSWRKGEAVFTRGLTAAVLLALVADVFGLAWVLYPGRDPYPVDPSEVVAKQSPPPLALEDPGEKGEHDVTVYSYGSGTDQRRPEFGAGVDWKSKTVDARKLLPEWKGFKAKAREWYWGFSLEEAPINGRVWFPDGPGPFPLVLVVHGNHDMEEHSDPGYAYLGELLASRGFITVSVDENFVNATWSGDFRGKEMPLRAWLLLEHLRQWREWNETKGHVVEGKVDLQRIALMGHSRGGEAISIAAAFNELDHFPDDATVLFDYGFSIRALVSIAQIDARYTRRIELRDVNFLALQGSYDNDEASFHGLRQLRRIDLSGRDAYRFKAGVYLHRGNHGQFNTVWGRHDAGPPYSWLLNLAPLVPGELQRQVAQVYIGAFLEATLHGKEGYVPLFRDPRVGRKWLPDAILIPYFSDSLTTPIATFEEDLDVETATFPGANIEAGNLALWREEELFYRDNQKQGTSAVVLGWNGDGGASAPSFWGLRFSGDGARFGASQRLTFFAGVSPEKIPGEGREEEETASAGETASVPDFEVELEDEAGATAAVSLRDFAPLAPPLRIQFLKVARYNLEAHNRLWEPTLQSYELGLDRFVRANSSLDLSRLAAIRFRFHGAGKGVVLLDDIAIRGEPPGFREEPPVGGAER